MLAAVNKLAILSGLGRSKNVDRMVTEQTLRRVSLVGALYILKIAERIHILSVESR